jgi:peptidoglycan-N-acetylmuramic acid deacetylase
VKPFLAILVVGALSAALWCANGGTATAVTAGAVPVTSVKGRGPSTATLNWWLRPRGAHRRPGIPSSAAHLLRRYSGVWAGSRAKKVIYLTFDEADEFGTTRRLIGILSRADVRASFFLTGRYMRAHPALTRSLARHGHLVCNHSYTHPSMAKTARRADDFCRQIRATERAFHAATGEDLARFFRPPYGAYSARCLALAERLGYSTVFWSFAHVDWDLERQPPAGVTLSRLLSASYPGAVYLLHAASPSNINALARAIRGLRSQGYGFAALDEL